MTIDELQLDNPVKAVEDVVAFAIMKAGFMRKENLGYPTKVSWTRSSRTDKGVHSVATVVSLKMHCKDETWQDDPEGLQYAAAINKCVLNPLLQGLSLSTGRRSRGDNLMELLFQNRSSRIDLRSCVLSGVGVHERNFAAAVTSATLGDQGQHRRHGMLQSAL